MAAVDALTRTASKLLTTAGFGLDPVFPPEVDDGFRWGVATISRPGAEPLSVLVGVPANGGFTAEELVSAIRDGAEDLRELADDEDLEIGSFRFEIY